MNGTYIHLWLREIKKRLLGRYIEDITKQERLIQIVLDKESLFISLYPEVLAACVKQRESKNYQSMSVFRALVKGRRISSVEQDSFAPVIRIGCNEGEVPQADTITMTIILYREAPNLVITKRNVYRKLFSRIVEKKPRPSLWHISGTDMDTFFADNQQHTGDKILKSYEGIDQALAHELTLERVRILQKIVRGEYWINPRLVSTKPLRISLFVAQDVLEYTSFNRLLQQAINQHCVTLRHNRAVYEKKKAIRNLKRRIDHLNKKLMPPDDIERYRIMGDSILAHLRSIKKGDAQVIVPMLTGQGTQEIILDPQKNPQENAQAYYRRYKKLKRGQPLIAKKIDDLRQELAHVQRKTWEPVSVQEQNIKKTDKSTLPFRVFHLDKGVDVYVGKNARSNDKLTFSYARPHDYFFHVRGYQGSHVILRAQIKRGETAAKKDIEAAAAIAAYFSKAKKQKRVPVSYTQRKYLKKSKQGKPGAVILIREEVIFVDPLLPAVQAEEPRS